MTAPNAEDFRREINRQFLDAQQTFKSFIEVNAGELHRKLGGYPARSHRMRDCCSVMRQLMKSGDEILYEPLKGHGASLSIRYCLPR